MTSPNKKSGLDQTLYGDMRSASQEQFVGELEPTNEALNLQH